MLESFWTALGPVCLSSCHTHTCQIKIPCRGPIVEISGRMRAHPTLRLRQAPRRKRDKMPREGETDPCARANPI